MSSPHTRPAPITEDAGLKHALGVLRYSRRALALVWQTSPRLTFGLGLLTLVAGLLPAGIAWVGKLIVDAVVLAHDTGLAADREKALWFIGFEAGLVVLMAGAQRGLSVIQSLLRAQLGHRVNLLILRKALTLDLVQFEDADFYDKLTRARREASSRPLSLVNRTFGLIQNAISLAGYAALLFAFSGWAVLILALAAVPVFVSEARFARGAFRLFSWRAPETRQQVYLETVVAREDYAKEVQLYGLGGRLVDQYDAIFQGLYHDDRSLTLRRGLWGYALGLLSTAAFYGSYGWIAYATVAGSISLGEMTMYLLVFKQGQSAFSASLTAIGGMYEDNLYLSNLYAYLDQPVPAALGTATAGPDPTDGVRFEGVGFTYPGADRPALADVSFHLRPGEKLALVGENGSGKTTLIKLLTRLYTPSTGRVTLDGLDLKDWDVTALRRRIGVIFQDFVRYQFLVGHNIAVGDQAAWEDEPRWQEAAEQGLAAPFIDQLPEGYRTQLGRWFKGGQELSIGQWQKIALSRAFMRKEADLLVLDEPTSAMDAVAEERIFEHIRGAAADQMAILISHRFSTVRMADHIIVLDRGRIIEQGDHASLMASDGQYARLFSLQARGYQ
ncbi:MAG: ABC transporter ATP-binding protein [Myxococcales bacterium]|nr:ABC transporter ATP-binding protein [Myxococcales bacterium]